MRPDWTAARLQPDAPRRRDAGRYGGTAVSHAGWVFINGRLGGAGMAERFSDRHGLRPTRALQVDSMDERLRAGLWNALHRSCLASSIAAFYPGSIDAGELLYKISSDFFAVPVDANTGMPGMSVHDLSQKFLTIEWLDVYDLCEFIAAAIPTVCELHAVISPLPENPFLKKFLSSCNAVMRNENSAYEFTGTTISPAMEKHESSEIAESLKSPICMARVHIDAALKLLSDRRRRDYRNSVKESIMAVEATCKHISGTGKGGVADALRAIKDKNPDLVPQGLSTALGNLYGYASSAGNIRHANLGSHEVDFHTAKLMLVLCSAIVNFLVHRAGYPDPD